MLIVFISQLILAKSNYVKHWLFYEKYLHVMQLYSIGIYKILSTPE
jgi:hypothetical protein